MTVAELAKLADVSPQTVRYYEREGLLDKPARRPSGYRDYNASAAIRLRFIVEAKAIGFTLKEIRQLTSIDSTSPQSCGSVQALVEGKLSDIGKRLEVMRRMEGLLKRYLERCKARDAEELCPVLEILERSTPAN